MKRDRKAMVTARVETVGSGPLATRGVVARPVVLSAGLVAAGIGLLTAGAWLSVPFFPVPITMQTLAVLVVGGLLGSKLGPATVVGYLALGLTGAPVFSRGLGGPAVLAGPTGGYLIGFIAAAFVMGLVADRVRAWAPGRAGSLRRLSALAAGAVVAEIAIYAGGIPWLALVGGLSLGQAVTVGLVPFLLGDLLKMAVAIGAVHGGRGLLARRGSLPF